MAGHREVVIVLLPLSLGCEGTNITEVTSVDEVMSDGVLRMSEWECRAKDEKMKIEKEIENSKISSNPIPTFILEPTTPSVSPEAETESGTVLYNTLPFFLLLPLLLHCLILVLLVLFLLCQIHLNSLVCGPSSSSH